MHRCRCFQHINYDPNEARIYIPHVLGTRALENNQNILLPPVIPKRLIEFEDG